MHDNTLTSPVRTPHDVNTVQQAVCPARILRLVSVHDTKTQRSTRYVLPASIATCGSLYINLLALWKNRTSIYSALYRTVLNICCWTNQVLWVMRILSIMASTTICRTGHNIITDFNLLSPILSGLRRPRL